MANLNKVVEEAFKEQEEKEKQEKGIENYIGELHGKQCFLPILLAKKIMQDITFKTAYDNESIYWYNEKENIYVNGGEKIIKKLSQKHTNGKISKYRISEVINQIQINTLTPREEFDENIDLLNVENGILNLKTQEITPNTPEVINTIKLPVIFDLTKDCPKIKQFLKEVVNEADIPVIQEMIGYCLYRSLPFHKSFMFTGEGSNGKSTLLSLIKNFVGEKNAVSISLQDLAMSRFAASNLYGKLINQYADLPDVALKSTGRFKILTGGDSLTADEKFKQPFTFTNTAKLLFSCNKMPQTTDITPAFWRRWIIIQFPNVFEGENKKENLINELTTTEELSGLLNFALEGVNRLLRNHGFSRTETAEEIQEQYEKQANPVKTFVKTYLEIDLDSYVEKKDLYALFGQFCLEELKLKAPSKKVFEEQLPMYLPQTGSERIRTENSIQKYVWKNIKFKTAQTTQKEDYADKDCADCSDCADQLYLDQSATLKKNNIYKGSIIGGIETPSTENSKSTASVPSVPSNLKLFSEKNYLNCVSKPNEPQHIVVDEAQVWAMQKLSKGILVLLSEKGQMSVEDLRFSFKHYGDLLDRVLDSLFRSGSIYMPRDGFIMVYNKVMQ